MAEAKSEKMAWESPALVRLGAGSASGGQLPGCESFGSGAGITCEANGIALVRLDLLFATDQPN